MFSGNLNSFKNDLAPAKRTSFLDAEIFAIFPDSLRYLPSAPQNTEPKKFHSFQTDMEEKISLVDVLWDKKSNLQELLQEMFLNSIHTDVVVQIGPTKFNCHKVVLSCYCDIMEGHSTASIVMLPENEISVLGFIIAYKWMLDQSFMLEYSDLFELYKAGKCLKMGKLMDICYSWMNDQTQFFEDTALQFYLDASSKGLPELGKFLLPRICRVFLTFVASNEFLNLNAQELCHILSLATIGVNSEFEIFMAAVRWINYKWVERQCDIHRVMRYIRFGAIPPFFLLLMDKGVPDCTEVDRIVCRGDVKHMITEGVTHLTIRHLYSTNLVAYEKELNCHNLRVDKPRQWVYDQECSYHHGSNCTAIHELNYKVFKDYLYKLQTSGKDHWRSLKTLTDFENNFCERCAQNNGKH